MLFWISYCQKIMILVSKYIIKGETPIRKQHLILWNIKDSLIKCINIKILYLNIRCNYFNKFLISRKLRVIWIVILIYRGYQNFYFSIFPSGLFPSVHVHSMQCSCFNGFYKIVLLACIISYPEFFSWNHIFGI